MDLKELQNKVVVGQLSPLEQLWLINRVDILEKFAAVVSLFAGTHVSGSNDFKVIEDFLTRLGK